MTGILRMTLTYFGIVPLQRWISWIGLVLMVVGVLIAALAGNPGARAGAPFFAFLGAALILLVPAMGGGAAMRIASTPSVLHLRPHGRLRMLLAATLAITIMATLFATPSLIETLFHTARPGARRAFDTSAFAMFSMAWTGIALQWLAVFALSRSQLLLALIGFIPIAGVQVGRYLAPLLPDPGTALAIGLIAWALFAIWYARTGTVTRLSLPGMSANTNIEDTPIGWIQSFFDVKDSDLSSRRAVSQYVLGASSPWRYGLGGLWMGVVFLIVELTSRSGARASAAGAGALLGLTPALSFASAAIAFSAVRRARHLWLRAGMDRARLFGLVESLAVRASVSMLVVAFCTLSIIATLRGAYAPSGRPLYFITQFAFSAAAFYGALAMTRGWHAADIWLGVGLFILSIVQAIVLRPRTEAAASVYLIAIGLFVVLALLLRWHAQRSWLALDWRVAKPARFGRVMGG